MPKRQPKKIPKRRACSTAKRTPSIFNRAHYFEKFISQTNVRISTNIYVYTCKCECAEYTKVRYSISTRFTLSLHPMPWIEHDTCTHIFHMCARFMSLRWPRKGQWNFHSTYITLYSFFVSSLLTTIQMQHYFRPNFLCYYIMHCCCCGCLILLHFALVSVTGRNEINDYFT